MHRIAILSKPCAERLQLQNSLKQNKSVLVYTYSAAADLAKEHQTQPFGLILLSVEEYKHSHMTLMDSLSKQLSGVPMVLMASRIPEALRRRFVKQNIPHSALLDRRHEFIDLPIVMGKMLTRNYESLREYCRYPVQKPVVIRNENGSTGRAVLTNISRGGAQLRYLKNKLDKNSPVTIHIPAADKTTSALYAEVVWINETEQTVGVQFKDTIQSRLAA